MDTKLITTLITGGGSGLGAATARLLSSNGSKVAILDLGRSQGSDVADSIGSDAIFLEADVTDETQVKDALEKTLEHFGSIETLINCAGIGTASKTVNREGDPFDFNLFRKTVLVAPNGVSNGRNLAKNRRGDHSTNG